MKTRHFRDLEVWQQAMALARDTYAATSPFPKSEVFGLASQMRRSAVSVPSNIAEGHGRTSDKSFAAFLSQARGSLSELETQTELAGQLGFIPQSLCEKLIHDINAVGRLLNGLMIAVRNDLNRQGSQR